MMPSKQKGNNNQNIQVFVRVRPSNASEHKSRTVVELKSGSEISVKDSKQSSVSKTFTFNNVFGPKSTQIDVYRSVVQPLIEEVLSGYNCTVFAYGQTGTGKTFTMEGERSPNIEGSWENDPLAGIVPRTLSQLFDELRLLQVDFSVKVSFLELYNEELFDLLSPTDDMTKLRIFEDSTRKGAVIVSGLEEVSVHTKADVYSIMKKGSEKRQTASTLMNARSSRSHTVFTVTVHIRESANEGEEFMRTGKINLVDLAGSENIGRSGAVDKRAREAGNINQSLLTLGRVITALVDRSPHIPYRESKLTRILQESLGGRTKTSIIATVSPAACNLEETLSTLDYAHRAKNIQNKPEINQRLCKKTLLKEYSEEIERLQRDLEATRQRTGVYLAQAEYDDMLLMINQLEADAKSKEGEMKLLVEEMEKQQAICDELCASTKALEDTVKERSAVRDEQVLKLSTLKTETAKIVTDTSEKDYLTLCHMETLKNLTSQANDLYKTTVESTENVERLYDKIDRTRNASQRNETKIQEFLRRNTQISEETKSLIETQVQSLSSAVGAISSSTNKNLASVQNHLENAMTTADGLMTVQNEAEPLCQIVKNMVDRENELQAEIDLHEKEYLKMYTNDISNYSTSFCDQFSTALAKQEELEAAFHHLELQVNMECGTLQDILQEWSSETPTVIEDATHSFSELMFDAVKILRNSQNDDDVFFQQYFDYQKFCAEKFEAISKLTLEINEASDSFAALVEPQKKSVHKSISTAIDRMEESKAVVRSAVNKEKSLIDTTLSRLFEQLDVIKTRVVKSISDMPLDLELVAMETVSQQVQSLINNSASFNNVIENLLHKNIDDYEHFSQLCDSHIKEILSNVTKAGQSAQEHAAHYSSAVQRWAGDVRMGAEVLSGIIRSLELSLTEKGEEYEHAVQDVLSYGAKPATPTGKTPVRSDLRIPRDLASTSPHERILPRIRSKYRAMSKLSTGDSPDTADSDVDSDMSLSEIEILANKENSLTEEMCFQSHIPKMRKPLVQNNQ